MLQLVYEGTKALDKTAPIASGTPNSLTGWAVTNAASVSTAKAAITADGDVVLTVTAEDGTAKAYYKIVATIGDGVTIKSGTNYDATPAAGKFKPSVDGGAEIDTTGVEAVSNKDFVFTVATDASEKVTTVTITVDGGSPKTLTADKDGKYTIEAADLTGAETVVIDATVAAKITIKAADDGKVWYGDDADNLVALDKTTGVEVLKGDKLTIWVQGGSVSVDDGVVNASPNGNVGQFQKWIIDTASATGDIEVTVA